MTTGLVALVAHHLGLSLWFYVMLAILFLVGLMGFLEYRVRTSVRTARRMELYAGLYILAFDLALAIELGRTYGFRIGGQS